MDRFAICFAVFLRAVVGYGAMVSGAQQKDWPANPERHTISITREAVDDLGRKMIDAAEAARPESGAWWVVKNGEPVMTCGLKAPHAVTKGALEYYAGKIREYQKKTWRWYTEPRSSLVYKATVSLEARYKLDEREFLDVYVVKMELAMSFAHVEEPAGGVSIQKKRTVVLSKDGVPQAVAGDGDETFPMWMM